MSFYFLCCLTIESKTAYLSNFICFIDIKTAIEFVYRTWLNFILYCCAALSPFYHEVKHYIVAKCIKNHKKLCNSQTHLMVNKITMINTPFLLFFFIMKVLSWGLWSHFVDVNDSLWHCAAKGYFHLVCFYFTNLISHNF